MAKKRKTESKKKRRIRIIRNLVSAYAKENNLKLGKGWFKYVFNLYNNLPLSLRQGVLEKKFKSLWYNYSGYHDEIDTKHHSDLFGDIYNDPNRPGKKSDYQLVFNWFDIDTETRDSEFFLNYCTDIIYQLNGEFNGVKIKVPKKDFDIFCIYLKTYCRTYYNQSPVINLMLADVVLVNNLETIPLYEVYFDGRGEKNPNIEQIFFEFKKTDLYDIAFENLDTLVSRVAEYNRKEDEAKKKEGKPEGLIPVVTKKQREEQKEKEKLNNKISELEEKFNKQQAEMEELKAELKKAKSKKKKVSPAIELEKVKLKKLKEIAKIAKQLESSGLSKRQINAIVKKLAL